MENEQENPDEGMEKDNPAEKELERLRIMFRIKLVNSFSKALQKSMEQFTWQEKTDFLAAMTQYVTILRKDKDRQEADNFVMEKILKVFQSKLQPAYRAKLFDHLEQDLWSTGLESIIPDVFKEIEASEWELTDEEYEKMLISIWHALNKDMEMHLVFGKKTTENKGETEPEPEPLTGIPGLKGRMQRAPGDNFTRLSQEQTALLIELLRFGRVILSDQYLNAKQAGVAFHILTGYSADGLRMKLNKKELVMLKTKDNLNEIRNTLTRLLIQIDSELKPPKGS